LNSAGTSRQFHVEHKARRAEHCIESPPLRPEFVAFVGHRTANRTADHPCRRRLVSPSKRRLGAPVPTSHRSWLASGSANRTRRLPGYLTLRSSGLFADLQRWSRLAARRRLQEGHLATASPCGFAASELTAGPRFRPKTGSWTDTRNVRYETALRRRARRTVVGPHQASLCDPCHELPSRSKERRGSACGFDQRPLLFRTSLNYSLRVRSCDSRLAAQHVTETVDRCGVVWPPPPKRAVRPKGTTMDQAAIDSVKSPWASRG
jgi:hypothetical protein